jgi:CHAT domain-containing protein
MSNSNSERQVAYRQVVQSLLVCPRTEEERILAANPDLVDEGLVKALKDRAMMMMRRNDPELGATIQRLVNFAQQLERKLVSESSDVVELEQEDYIRFSFELLQIVANSQGDGEIVHQFFDRHLAYLNEELLAIFPQSIAALLERSADPDRQAYIRSIAQNLSIDLQDYSKGDRSINLALSIACQDRSSLLPSLSDEQIDAPEERLQRADKDRQNAYSELVQALIECPLNDEDRVLTAHPKLVDKGLVIALLEVAEIRKKRNNPDSVSTIEWLESFAEQLSQKLELQPDINNQTDDEEADLCFQEVASIPEDEEIVYQFTDDNDNLEIESDEQIPTLVAPTTSPIDTLTENEEIVRQFTDDNDNLEIEPDEQIPTLVAPTTSPIDTLTENEEIVRQFTDDNDNLEIEPDEQIPTLITPTTSPIDTLTENRTLGWTYFSQGSWQLAADAYETAIQSIETSQNWVVDEQQRQEMLKDALSIYENALQCAINLQNYPQAIQYTERSRSLDPAIAGQIQVETINYTDIQKLIHSPHTAILTCYSTNDDTHIFIIKQSGAPTIHTCKNQGKQKFQNWLQKTWINPSHEDTANWVENLPRLLHDISQRLELYTLIATHLTDINELIIVPHLNLQHIPFAALPLTPGGGGLLGDRFIIRSIPSLQSCQLHPSVATANIGTEDTNDSLCRQSTLWSVDDYVSVIFNVMYQQRRKQDTHRAAALRIAQSQLRNLTGAQFQRDYYPHAIEYVTKHHPTLKTPLEHHLEPYCQLDKPFESPYYWASFITQGMT